MISSNLERSKSISILCDEILTSNDNIFFVASLNKNGKAIDYKLRNDRLITKMKRQETEMLFMQRSLQISLGMEFDDIMGPLNSILIQRETLLEFIFPYSEGTILVMSDLGVISSFLSKKISFILRNFNWEIQTTICE
ncbi:MAG: hypothetical protein PVI88_02530 [Nitrosopumilaceae archaeon]|jgi:hypothetical protein